MRSKRAILRRRRGLSMFEVLLAGTMMVACISIMATISSHLSTAWQKGMSITTSQLAGETAIQKMLPSIRAARSYTLNNSGRLTLQMPSYDSSGNLVVPMTNGHTISFYLSNSTGSTTASGTTLWRAVDGTPDTSWSLSGTKPQVSLDSGGLLFTAIDTDTVNVRVTVSNTVGITLGQQTNTFTNQQDAFLRNAGL